MDTDQHSAGIFLPKTEHTGKTSMLDAQLTVEEDRNAVLKRKMKEIQKKSGEKEQSELRSLEEELQNM